MFPPGFYKMVISKAREKTSAVKKIEIVPLNGKYQIARYEDKKVFHENLELPDTITRCSYYLTELFLRANSWDSSSEYSLMISKKGNHAFSQGPNKSSGTGLNHAHNRRKKYILEEGTVIKPLIDMGVCTPAGQVIKSKFDKFRQINRFLEIIDDTVKDPGGTLNIIDFGCGKSYLTFVVYYYFTAVRNLDVHIIGLDLQEDVIKKCGETARRYGYKNLSFEVGDINGYQPKMPVDMVISLHA
jgi:hypothetical protein